MMKILTDKRGNLQGMSLQSIVRQAYGPDAQYRHVENGETAGTIERNGQVLDTVIDVHNAA